MPKIGEHPGGLAPSNAYVDSPALADQPKPGPFRVDVIARLRDDWFVASLLTIALLFIMNGFVLYNALNTPFNVGYDFAMHVGYAQTLSTGRLPEREDTDEYFSPPLAYVLPALAYAVSGSLPALAKVGQLQNVPVSIGITLLIVIFALRLSPDKPFHAPMALLALAILPVYYRTFAFLRGEPLLTFFLLLGLYLLYRSDGALKDAVIVGICAGLAALCRQWAFLALPGVLIFAVVARHWRWKHLIAAGLPFLIVAGWYYLSLTLRFGSPATYLLAAGGNDYPWQNYFGLGNGLLFTNPIRPSFDHQIIPTFYSDLWGDYWGYSAGHGHGIVDPNWVPILTRMNIVNLLPTAVTAFALIRNLRQRIYELFYLALVSTVIGYLAYILCYYADDGDTIKASYVLHMYPLIALIVGGFLARYWRAALAVGIVLLLHNSLLFTWHGYTVQLPSGD